MLNANVGHNDAVSTRHVTKTRQTDDNSEDDVDNVGRHGDSRLTPAWKTALFALTLGVVIRKQTATILMDLYVYSCAIHADGAMLTYNYTVQSK